MTIGVASRTFRAVSELETLRRADPGYEEARLAAVWNGRKPDQYPELIVYPMSDADVVSAVRLGKERGLKIGVRSGGHSWVGNGVRDGGLLIDLSRMRDIDVDAATMTAAVRPAVNGRELMPRLEQIGAWFPTGTCPTVGIGGYLLGGGFHWAPRLIGPAAASLVAIDVVLADGELIHADDDSHPEIMWAARGAGPGLFGVVTRFHLRLHPLPKALLSSIYVFPSNAYEAFAVWYFEAIASLPPEVSAVATVAHSQVPGDDSTVIAFVPIAFTDSPVESAALLAPLAESPVAELAIVREGPHPWTMEQGYQLLDQMYPKGLRYRSDAIWINPDADGFLLASKEIAESLPTRHSHLLFAPMLPKEQPNAAFSVQTLLSVHAYGICESPDDDDAMLEWVGSSMRDLEPFSNGGGKVNDADLEARPQAVLSTRNAARLEELRAAYDPEGLFDSYLGETLPNSS